ncbi:MAG: DUF1684 domain-containing protein [Acidobacteriota bacterium]|nr:DUF1684 domain-containing protein [Acidobacteriota bacterium]
MHSNAFAAAVAALLLLNLIPGDSGACSGSDTESWRKEILDWRVKHAAELRKPGGWLSLAGLEWLVPGENSFGGAADNKIHLASAAEHLGVLELKDTTVTLKEPAGGFPNDFMVAESPAKSQVLRTDLNSDKAAVHMIIGTLNLYVIRRADRFALRVKDSQSEALRTFHALKWYEPDPRYRVQARWTPYVPAKKVTLVTLAGTADPQPVPGVAEFQLLGVTYRLEPVLETGPDRLFFILRDTTSTSTTYGACRFLYTSPPTNGVAKEGELTLDFNRLENPPCAYTSFSTCPLPPQGNRLQIALPVGEQRYHE